MTHTGLRFPKPSFVSFHIAEGASATETIGGVVHYKASRQIGTIVAPARYSQVRKVRFYVTFRNAIATALVNARLRIWASSSSGVNTNPEKRTLTPGAASGTYFTISSIVNRLYAKFGTASPNSIASTTAGSQSMLEIEFDRFDGLSNDFFTAWDSATGQNDYILFHPAIAANAGGPTNPDVDFFAFGLVVVQAPSPTNNSTTYVQVWHPLQLEATGQSAFDSADATASAQIRGAWRFRYNASDWDGITSAHIMLLDQKRIAAGATDIRLERVLSNTQGTASTTTLLSASPVFGGAGLNLSELGWWRSADILSLLVDGADFTFDYRNAAGAGEVIAFIEIIQANHTKTVSYHHVNPSAIAADNGLTSGTVPQIFQGACLFDPQFFANYPDTLLLKKNIVGQLNHRTATLAPEYEYAINSNITEDQNGPTGITPTTAQVNPEINATPTGTVQWKYQDLTILANDPINLAGARRCFARLGGTWISATLPASPGSFALMYAISVPNTEVLELGPLFPLTAFNPEGCAATAAGAGDPGVLVITNGSTIPKKFNPQAHGSSQEIEDAGIPEPFPDEVPTSFLIESVAASPAGGLGIGTYVYRYTFRNCCTGKESNPNPEDIVIDTTGASPAAKITISFNGVRIPGDPQICQICLYRTVVGGAFPVMAKVGCFDITQTSLFVDTLSDLALDFANEPLSQLNAPPPCCPYITDFKSRLWLFGDIPDLSPVGSVSVVTGSDIVLGDDLVEWDRCLVGKYIQVEGDCRAYEIAAVLPPPAGTSPPINRLQLVEEYEGATRTGQLYHICGRPNRLYFSEPFEPEYWPEINFIDVEPGDGDRGTGLGSNFNRLVVCKRYKTYVVTYAENPVTEGTEATRISSDIGCIAPRSFAQVENGTVWLAERGLALFDGRGVQHVPESVEMNRIFIDPDHPDYVRRDVNGRVIGAVGVYYAKREQYLLLLPSKRTIRGADMMLVWNVKLRNITLLSFCQEFASMVVAKDTDGNDRVYLGDTNGFVWIYDVGFTDGVGSPGSTGTVRGLVTSSGVDPDSGASFVDDDSASFIQGGLPGLAGLSGIAGLSGAFSGAAGNNLGISGVCVLLRAPGAAFDDPWTSRIVFAATRTRLYVTPEVASLGDITGWDYMLGPIMFDVRTKPSNYGTDDNAKRHWRHALMFVPQAEASPVRVEVLVDNLTTDELATELTSGEPPEVGSGRLFDMSQPKGRLVGTMPRLIHQLAAVRFFNHGPEEPLEILNHSLMFQPQEGR